MYLVQLYCWHQVTPTAATAASQQLSQPGQGQGGITGRDRGIPHSDLSIYIYIYLSLYIYIFFLFEIICTLGIKFRRYCAVGTYLSAFASVCCWCLLPAWHFIPGRSGMGGLDLAGNSSVAAVAVRQGGRGESPIILKKYIISLRSKVNSVKHAQKQKSK